MKISITSALVFATLTASAAAQCATTGAIAFFRADNHAINDHFYTTSSDELNAALSTGGYTFETVACNIFPSQAAGTIPFFRLRSPSEHHFYTSSQDEATGVVANAGFVLEGVAGFLFPDATCGGTALFRLFNSKLQDHFYTTDPAEKANAIATGGYADEGVAGFVL